MCIRDRPNPALAFGIPFCRHSQNPAARSILPQIQGFWQCLLVQEPKSEVLSPVSYTHLDTCDDLSSVLSKTVQDNAQRFLTNLVCLGSDTDSALSGCKGLMACQEAEALGVLFQKHLSKVSMSQTYLTPVSYTHLIAIKENYDNFDADGSGESLIIPLQNMINTLSVSYTHLDVYKRQPGACALKCGPGTRHDCCSIVRERAFISGRRLLVHGKAARKIIHP